MQKKNYSINVSLEFQHLFKIITNFFQKSSYNILIFILKGLYTFST
jgi:hypothetical protein